MIYPVRLTIRHEPVPKPRGRQLLIQGPKTPPGVVAWRSFKAAAQEAALKAGWRWSDLPPMAMHVASFHAIPTSWSRAAKLKAFAAPHLQKPDLNHVWNAVADALFDRDEQIAAGLTFKRWDDGAGPRVVVVLEDGWPGSVAPFEAMFRL